MLFRSFFMALLCAQLLKAEIFTSVQHLTNAFKVEKKIANALSNYLAAMEQKLERIRRYLNDYEQVEEESKMLQQISSSPPGTDSMDENLAGNPLQAFHLMKRLTIDWKHLQEHDPFVEWKEVEAAMNTGEVFGFSQFNDEEDLKGTAQAIILLQSIYQLNTSSLVNGNIGGIQTAAELTAQDCLYLGKHSFNLEMYYNSVLWFEQAYVLAGLEKNRTITQSQVIPFMNKAYEMFDEKTYGDSPIFISNKLANARKELDDASARKFHLGDEYMSGTDVFRNYEALCRGEQLLSDSYVAKLKCYYDNRNSPYLVLMPAKTEKLHIDPEILLFHNVISDREIEDIKLLTNTELSRGLVRGGEDERTPSKVSKERISKIAWLDRAVENYIFKSVGVRVDALTGLSVSHNGSAEQLQVGNYGTGGHYNPHVDYFKKQDLSAQEEYEYGYGVGDRMATFMFYLSNVNKGGATAFPITGVSVFPEKGSAAFWFNLRKSGIGDYRSLHGGCPVVHGSKWVANKWIRERNQMFIRPCSLLQKE